MPSATRRRLSPEARRLELLAFGRRLFAEHPVDAFTMDEIAERAGVSKGLLYSHFGGRRGFYVATIEAIAAEVDVLTEPEAGVPFVEALRLSLGRYLAWVRDNGDVYRVLVEGGLGVDSEVAAVVEGLRRRLSEQVRKRASIRRSAAVDVALYGWVCFVEHACLEWLTKPRLTAAAMTRLLEGALLGALSSTGVRIDA